MKSKFMCIPVIAVMLLSLLSFGVFAAGDTLIYGRETKCVAGEDTEVNIPLRIKGNPGIMGFKLIIYYPESAFYSPAVERGGLLGGGSLTDSINEKTSGSFDVLWSNSSNIYGDGELINLKFKIKDKAEAGNYTILVRHSQEDTFNEKWEDVVFNTENISVEISEKETVFENEFSVKTEIIDETTENIILNNPNETTQTESESTETTSSDSSESSGDLNRIIVEAVNDAVKALGIENVSSESVPDIKNIPEDKREEVLKKVSAAVSQKLGEEKSLSFDEIEKAIAETISESKKSSAGEQKTATGKYIIPASIVTALILIFVISAIFVTKKKQSSAKTEVNIDK